MVGVEGVISVYDPDPRVTLFACLCDNPWHAVDGREILRDVCHSSGAVCESRWPSWAVRPNEPSGFLGRKDLMNHASALVTACT